MTTTTQNSEMYDNFYNACKNGNIELVKNLINNGVDPTVYNNNPTDIAYTNKHYDIVELLFFL